MLIDLFRTSGSVDFRVLLSRFLILFAGVIYDKLILPPQKELKIGQNNPENQRTLSFERGLIAFLSTFLEIPITPFQELSHDLK